MVASVKVTKINGICNRYDRHFYDVFFQIVSSLEFEFT